MTETSLLPWVPWYAERSTAPFFYPHHFENPSEENFYSARGRCKMSGLQRHFRPYV
jgi:hypothetical protein